MKYTVFGESHGPAIGVVLTVAVLFVIKKITTAKQTA